MPRPHFTPMCFISSIRNENKATHYSHVVLYMWKTEVKRMLTITYTTPNGFRRIFPEFNPRDAHSWGRELILMNCPLMSTFSPTAFEHQ